MPNHDNPTEIDRAETDINYGGIKPFDIVYSRRRIIQRNEHNDLEHHHESKDPQGNSILESVQSPNCFRFCF